MVRARSRAAEGEVEEGIGCGSVASIRCQDAAADVHRAGIVEGQAAGEGCGSGAGGFAKGAGVVKPAGADRKERGGVLGMEQRPGAIGDDAVEQDAGSGAGPNGSSTILQRSV